MPGFWPLPCSPWVAAAAAVAVADVEHPVGPELQLPAVVVALGVGDLQQLAVTGPDARGALARVQLPDDLVALLVREVDVELAVRSRSSGENATESRPRSPPDCDRSCAGRRTAWRDTLPLLTVRIVPSCSTTNRRLSPGAEVT